MKSQKFTTMNFKPLKVGIIGLGTMGLQLTKLFLKKKYQVFVVTRDIDKTKQKLTEYFSKNSDFVVQDVVLSDSILSLKDCDFIFECIVENLQVKKELFSLVLGNSRGVLASCTSTFTLEALSKDLEFKEKLNVIHFSNPVSAMNVVEIVYSPSISMENRDLIKDLLAKIEYIGIEVPDIPGFVINSLLFPLIYNAIQIHCEHGITKSNIDMLMKNGCGFPMGPFEIIDLVGVNTTVNVLRNLGYELSDQVLSTLIANK